MKCRYVILFVIFVEKHAASNMECYMEWICMEFFEGLLRASRKPQELMITLVSCTPVIGVSNDFIR
jgi:hypothetical protein